VGLGGVPRPSVCLFGLFLSECSLRLQRVLLCVTMGGNVHVRADVAFVFYREEA
jgi:hypothetical protein